MAQQRVLCKAQGAAREFALAELGRLLGSAREHVSSLAFQLSPPVLYDFGLRAAGEWLAEELARLYRFRTCIEPGPDLRDLDEPARATLFRALRELLINAIRHSGTDRARVAILDLAENVPVEVQDSGVGFDPQRRPFGCGLLSLRSSIEHLGGSLVLCSQTGGDTVATVQLPRARRPREVQA